MSISTFQYNTATVILVSENAKYKKNVNTPAIEFEHRESPQYSHFFLWREEVSRRSDCITEPIQPPILPLAVCEEKVKRKPLYKNYLNSSDDSFVMARNCATVLQREIITATGWQRSVWFIVALAAYVKPCFDVSKSWQETVPVFFSPTTAFECQAGQRNW